MRKLSPDQRIAGRKAIYLNDVSLIIPYYRQPKMLAQQLETFRLYDDETREKIKVIIVDDGSPEPAIDVVGKDDNVRVYRITKDIPWHRSGARNLGVTVSETDWVLNVDTDHVLPPLCANALFETEVDLNCWYRFPRCRVGKADETRRKDAIPDDCEFGRIKEHIDSHLMTRDLFLSSPYDEDYAGCLGGGTPFLERMKERAEVKLMPPEVHLYVYTRSVVPDASVFTLDRDTSEYKRRRREKERMGNTEPKNILNFDWERVL